LKKKNQSLDYLDVIDSRPLAEICGIYQTNAINKSKSVSEQQKVIIKKMNYINKLTNNTLTVAQKKRDNLQTVGNAMSDIEVIRNGVEINKKILLRIFQQLDDLQEILPKNILKQVKNPLFKEMVDENVDLQNNEIVLSENEKNEYLKKEKLIKEGSSEIIEKKNFYSDEEN
jgi:hypothetical protein